MKVRFGFTIGPETGSEQLPGIVDDLERLGFDSLWIPEILLQPTFDPIVALTFAAARTSKLKIGSHLILPGKNPVILARQLAHLDRLSRGRLLIVGVLGLPDEADTGAQMMERRERTAVMSEMVPLLRELWTGDVVDHDGERFHLKQVQVTPTPMQDPLEIWLSGQVPSALRRCGELGEGWMPGLVRPHEAAAMRAQIEDAAAAAGREMDPEHYGVNLFYVTDEPPAEMVERLAARRKDGDIEGLIPVGMDGIRARVDRWLEVGFSKFLLRPMVPPDDWTAELEMLADEILPLTT